MMKILTFIDSSVLIYAAKKPTAETIQRRFRALQLLSDPGREFVASEFLKLEVLPIPTFFKRPREVKFYNTFFDDVSVWIDIEKIMPLAFDIAASFGVSALDALHVAAAKESNAEFISAEKPTKPIYRAYDNISSIY